VGLNLHHTSIVGGFLAAVFLLLSAFILHPKNALEFLASSMLIFSPSIMLGVERGNMDLLIFTMIVIAGYMIFSKLFLFRSFGFLILYFAAFLKFYPAASFGILINTIKTKLNFWLMVLFTALLLGIFFWLTYTDLLLLKNNIPRPSGWLSFGVASFYRSTISGNWLTVATLLTIVILFAIALKISNRTNITEIPTNPLNKIFFLLGTFNLTFCFFVNTNYDYRSLFFILTFPYFFELLQNGNTKLFTRCLIFLFFGFTAVTVWFDFVRHALEYLGKISGHRKLADFFTWTFFALKQLGSWGSITILTAFAIEMLKKPLSEKLPGFLITLDAMRIAKKIRFKNYL
jgi:hypothetical protein